MKSKLRTLLLIIAIGILAMDIYDTGLRLGNILIIAMVAVCFAVNVYMQRKQRKAAEALPKKGTGKRRSSRRRTAGRTAL